MWAAILTQFDLGAQDGFACAGGFAEISGKIGTFFLTNVPRGVNGSSVSRVQVR
jgi:hypothetical protein